MNDSLADLVFFLSGIGIGGLFAYLVLVNNTYNVNVTLDGEALLVRRTYTENENVEEEQEEEEEEEEQEEEEQEEQVANDSIEVDENLNDHTNDEEREEERGDDTKMD